MPFPLDPRGLAIGSRAANPIHPGGFPLDLPYLLGMHALDRPVRPMLGLPINLKALGTDEVYDQLILGTSGLTNYWKLEESGNTAADSKGANPGTYTGIARMEDAQRRYLSVFPQATDARAAAFDKGYVNVPDSALLEHSQFSIEGWIFSFLAGSDVHYVARKEGGVGFALRLADSTGFFEFYISTGGVTTVLGGVNLAGSWRHLVGTYDGATMTGYVDGASVGTAAKGSITYDGAALVMGNNANTEVERHMVSRVALYNRALTADEVKEHNVVGRGLWAAPEPLIRGQAVVRAGSW